jgi:hypothetical protein
VGVMACAGSRADPDSFSPVRVLSRLFRRLFLQDLQAAYDGAGSVSSAR